MYGFNRFALLSPEGEPGGGAAGGESPEGGDSGKDESVPVSRLTAALANQQRQHEQALQALREEMAVKLADATKPKADPPKRYNRAELLAAVGEQRITQEQADAEWERQIREDGAADSERIARETVQRFTRTENVATQIADYAALLPALKDRGSDDFAKVKQEYDFLIANGHDRKSLGTELTAIRMAFGPLETVRAAKSGKRSTESHAETGGEAGPKGGKGTLKLTERERAHYEPKVGHGKMYPDWKAVDDELKFARPEVRQKNGARV